MAQPMVMIKQPTGRQQLEDDEDDEDENEGKEYSYSQGDDSETATFKWPMQPGIKRVGTDLLPEEEDEDEDDD
ncbi:hypothetical protein E4U16_001093 [Claviceps sp. LM84 group G4]|nr:hypothetical protein E4U16_001093 [Claviceps sp. LM84 group G4]KAG6071354.1 hypothetical protein E4U33_003750 [Claviceps sp. LM78 group G4]